MPKATLVSAALLLAAPLVPQDRVTFPDLLHGTSDLLALARPPVAGERSIRFSSYDRRSDAGPSDPDAWFANGDRGQFLRVEERDGRREHVLVDVEGPGAIVRIWSANPSGTLSFYFDGAAEPGWRVDFAALLRGEVEPIGEPLAGMRSRGGNCHLPIPFARRVVVTADSGDFYYHVDVARFPEATAVETFRPALLVEHADAIAAAREALADGPGFPVDCEHVGKVASQAAEAFAGGVLWEQRIDGKGILRSLELRVTPDRATEVPLEHLLRAIVLRVRVGSETTVEVPFADFFGSAPRFVPWRGLALEVTADGYGRCRFPMPFRGSLEAALLAEALPCDVQVASHLTYERTDPGDLLPFRASWHQVRDRRTLPRGDHLVLDARGKGRLVGTTLVVRNPTRAWWGEGDEKFWVDGESFPSTFGTGTEDYFGYAWCSPTPFQSALHAQPFCDGPGNRGYTCNHRTHVLDAVPFERSLRFDLEVWHWQDVVVDYATVAYWYGAPGATSGLPPLPEQEERLPRELEPLEVFTAPGVLEAEALRELERTGGERHVQDMSGFEGSRWSRDAQLWWTGAEPGDRLVLALPVPEAGRYRLEAAFTRARDYGILEVWCKGQRLGEAIDLYHPEVVATGPVTVGEVELEQGDAALELRVTGRNERAVPRHMVGVDWLKLVRVD